MKLLNAAKYFDRDSVYDGYTNEYLFKSQFSSFDSGQIDGSFQRRRVMSVAPGIQMPYRRSVIVNGEHWLSAALMSDGFFDAPIRCNTPCMLVTDTFTVLSPAQAALRVTVGPVSLHAHTRYMKDTQDSNRSSDSDPYFDIYVAETELIPDGYFLKSQNALYHIKSVHTVPEGYIVASSDQIARDVGPDWDGEELWDRAAEVNVQFDGARDPVTEQPTGGVMTTGIILDITKLYRIGTAMSPTPGYGDRALIVSKLAVPTIDTGQPVRVNNTDWVVYSSQLYEDAWLLHLRRP